MVYQEINITSDDLRKMIYFILMKFRADPLHRGGTSSKRDLIGAYIERWFNKTAETIILNKILENKKYKIMPDYFLYKNDSEKNAPDVLGLKKENGDIVPFSKYTNGTWKHVGKMPSIEVKVIRKDQVLIGVREPQMIDDYYLLVESNLNEDYLTAIFDESLFDPKFLSEISMSEIFVESDDNNQLIPHSLMKKTSKIGTMRLIGTYTKEEFKRLTVLCQRDVDPYYFSNAVSVSINVEEIKKLSINSSGEVIYHNGIDEALYIPFYITGKKIKNIVILKKNKGSLYIRSECDLNVNGILVSQGDIKIEFKKFERNSTWTENVGLKSTLKNFGKDSTEILIKTLDDLAKV